MTDNAPVVFRPSRRPLTESERRLLRGKIRSHIARGGWASRVVLPIAGGTILLLWLWTILASDAPWPVVTGFWLVAGASLALWLQRDMRKQASQFESMARGLESALRRNTAEVYEIRARAFAELEEIEDEGACYAFELEGDRLVFVVGQEFYDGARFPSLDFSLVYILDEEGETVDMIIDKRGAKVPPAKTIPADTKRMLAVPDHLEVRSGRIDDIESWVAS
jgi:hypothetical protein